MTEQETKLDHTKGRWPVCDDSPLRADMLEDYIEKFGKDRAQGYIDAVQDFQKHFQRCFTGFSSVENGVPFYRRRVGATSMVKKLFHRNSELLKRYTWQKPNSNGLKNE